MPLFSVARVRSALMRVRARASTNGHSKLSAQQIKTVKIRQHASLAIGADDFKCRLQRLVVFVSDDLRCLKTVTI